MTAPALPGAAPDPARLPPEVESVIKGIDPLKAIADWENADDIAHAVKAYVVAQMRSAIARALGGDGEPAGPNAKSMIEAIRLIGVTLGQDDDWVDYSPALVEFAAERIRSLYTRPAATRAEVERAVAEERDACAKVCLDLRCRWCRDLGEETNANHADCCACRDDAAAIRARGGAS